MIAAVAYLTAHIIDAGITAAEFIQRCWRTLRGKPCRCEFCSLTRPRLIKADE